MESSRLRVTISLSSASAKRNWFGSESPILPELLHARHLQTESYGRLRGEWWEVLIEQEPH